MKKIQTNLKDCFIIEPDKFGDNRGYYSPFFVEEKNIFEGLTMKTVAQGARSMSGKGIVRGLHFQKDPYTQAKFVECINGSVIDVVVDIRKDSPTYGQYTSVLLSSENGRQLYVPRGFAHGFVSLEENTIFQYLVDNDYKPSHEDGILWNDSDLNIKWDDLFEKYNIKNPILSDKDKVRKQLKDIDNNFYMNKRYLITGCKGQLGYDIVRELNSRGIYDILALDIDDMDITNSRIVNKIIEDYHPLHIFHCAAWTNVDGAEENREMCRKVNVDGTKNMVEAARRVGAKFTYISTDYVFDGKKDGLYEVTSAPSPINYYGLTKYLGEEEVRKYDKSFIVRISWVFGINGKNFIKTMLSLAENHTNVNVINDQIGSPTYTKDLAKLLVDMQNTGKYGTYHATNDGFCSWADLAKYTFETNEKSLSVTPIETKDYPTKAVRPLNSKLSKQSLVEAGFELLPDWHDAVDRYSKELEEQKVKKLGL